jgi:hypothetical protein
MRVLSKKFPGPEEAAKLLDALPYKDDRSMALVYAGFLDALLEKLIIRKLPHMTPRLEGRLFTERGPLSDFDSKILMAEALRILPDIDFVAPVLNSIKKIRNVFGHSILDVSFETKEISDEIAVHIAPFAITLQKGFIEAAKKQPLTSDTEIQFPGLTSKRAFYFVSSCLCAYLDNTHKEITGAWLLAEYTWS